MNLLHFLDRPLQSEEDYRAMLNAGKTKTPRAPVRVTDVAAWVFLILVALVFLTLLFH